MSTSKVAVSAYGMIGNVTLLMWLTFLFGFLQADSFVDDDLSGDLVLGAAAAAHFRCVFLQLAASTDT